MTQQGRGAKADLFLGVLELIWQLTFALGLPQGLEVPPLDSRIPLLAFPHSKSDLPFSLMAFPGAPSFLRTFSPGASLIKSLVFSSTLHLLLMDLG